MLVTPLEAVRLAAEHMRRLELDAAERILRQTLEQDSGFRLAAGYLLMLLLTSGRRDEARRLAEVDTSTDPAFLDFRRMCDLWEENAPPAEPVGTVVIPAWRAAETLPRALDSVLRAVLHLREATGQPEARVRIVVADDASPDATSAVAVGWAEDNGFTDLVVLRAAVNGGPAAARNLGAARASGECLWFLDADDEFLPDHLVFGWSLLRAVPMAGFVRSGILFDGIDDRVLPEYRIANQNTSSINLCVRPACHHFVGGYPELPVFRQCGGEDAAYSDALSCRFYGIRKMHQTVFYRWRQGNSLDAQRDRFTGDRAGEQADMSFTLCQTVARIISEGRILALAAMPPTPGLPPVRAFNRPFENLLSDPEYGLSADGHGTADAPSAAGGGA
ncbi:MAG: glycosyltransferase [Caulobacter sp.]|nr:glycosyltransferase [Caulobacter sp.]